MFFRGQCRLIRDQAPRRVRLRDYQLGLTLFASACCLAWAGAPGQPAATMATTQWGKKLVHVQGKPTPLFWAFGIEAVADLPRYQTFGFNTVYVDVPWPQTATVEELRDMLAKRQALVQEAGRAGLLCIIGLEVAPLERPFPTAPGLADPTQSSRPRIDLVNEEYARGLRQWLDLVTQAFGPMTNVIGYGVQHEPRERITIDDLGFTQYLQNRYGEPGVISRRWQLPVSDWNAIGLDLPGLIDNERRLPLSAASLDAAMYQWGTTFQMLEAWAREIRARNPGKLLFTGRISDYKTLTCIPPTFDAIIPSAFPGAVEADLIAHNPHAVDIARQAGMFAAIPCLLSAPNLQVREGVLDRQGLWMKEAFLHGASGACFQNWNHLRVNESARLRISEAVDQVTTSRIAEANPAPTMAILYEPFAGGAVVNEEPLYGYLPRCAPNEPSDLLFTYRRGHRFGQVDVLSHQALLRTPLERYGAILAPAAAYVDPAAQFLLDDYVRKGGVLVADLGFAAAQTDGELGILPGPLPDLFGIIEVSKWMQAELSVLFSDAHPLFPSIEPWSESTGNAGDGGSIGGAVGIARLYPDTVPFGIAMIEPRGAAFRRGRRPLPPEFSAITVRKHGEGFGVFAPFSLWSHWLPTHDGYQAFHRDLLIRRAVIETAEVNGLFADRMPNHQDPATVGPAIAAFAGGVAMFNGSAEAVLLSAPTLGRSGTVLIGADVAIGSRPVTGPTPYHLRALSPEEPVPVSYMELHASLQPGELRFCRPIPLEVTSDDQAVSIQIAESTSARFVVKTWVAVQPSVSIGRKKPDRLQPARMTWRLRSGEYAIAPGSRHLVRITSLDGRQQFERGYVEADRNGVLEVARRGIAFALTITPVS